MVEKQIKKIQETFTHSTKKRINYGGCGVVADGFRKLAEANGQYTTIWLVERFDVGIANFFDYEDPFTHIMIEIKDGYLTDITGTFPKTDFNICDRHGKILVPAMTPNNMDNWYSNYYITELTDEKFAYLLQNDKWNSMFVNSRLNKSGQLAKTFAKQIEREVTVKMLPRSELYVIDFDSES
jgi:hypothetical protein